MGYLEITENKAIPSNVEFYLTDCTGYQDIDDPETYADASHAIAADMCYSNLVDGNKINPYAGGQADRYLRASFNSFTFEGNSDENVDKISSDCASNRQCPADYMNTCTDNPDC